MLHGVRAWDRSGKVGAGEAPRARDLFGEVEFQPPLRGESAGDFHRVTHRTRHIVEVFGNTEPLREYHQHVVAAVVLSDRAAGLVVERRASHAPEREWLRRGRTE